MNKESGNTRGEVHEHLSPTEAHFVLSGNASVDGASHRGWFIGHFLASACDVRFTSAVEVKWGVYSAGEKRSSWGLSEKATTLCILFKGSVQLIFPQEEHLLSREGDYVIWSADIPHQWRILEETRVLTVRWPSMPEAYQERQVFPFPGTTEN